MSSQEEQKENEDRYWQSVADEIESGELSTDEYNMDEFDDLVFR